MSLVHENGNVMLWDCGHSDTYSPSQFLPAQDIQRIDRFFVTNYDEDHISDLPELRSNLHITTLHRNPSISAEQLRALKLRSGPISPAMQSLLQMIQGYTFGPPDPPPPFPGVYFSNFWNLYGSDFEDTNNISFITFLQSGSHYFIIPGDLEEAGWKQLLSSEDFRTALSGVNVFIASHHGRESGYCREVFDYCTPQVVVFSDSSVKHATQEMANTYANHAMGVTFNGQTRKVLSTRNDGSIMWTVA